MPFYEYECPACKYYAEVLQKISDKPLTKCPSCGKKGFKRLMSAPVFRLKGSGWYETDFKSDQDNKRNLAGPEQEESKPAPEEKGGEKPETKVATEAGAATAEKPKADASTPKADKTARPTSEPAARRAGKRAGAATAKAPAKAAAKRRAKPASRRAVRRGRRR